MGRPHGCQRQGQGRGSALRGCHAAGHREAAALVRAQRPDCDRAGPTRQNPNVVVPQRTHNAASQAWSVHAAPVAESVRVVRAHLAPQRAPACPPAPLAMRSRLHPRTPHTHAVHGAPARFPSTPPVEPHTSRQVCGLPVCLESLFAVDARFAG
eukprot:6775272-Prymnesium_polylepis.1